MELWAGAMVGTAIDESERWAVIDEFPDYQVSSNGRFRNRWSGKILSGADHESGYRNIGFTKDGKLHVKLAHRIVAKAFVEQPSELKDEVNHKNKDRQDNRACNLEWLTHRENTKHSKKKTA